MLSLSILVLLLVSYGGLITDLLQRTKQASEQLTMQRLLYEETRAYKKVKNTKKQVQREGKHYEITFIQQDNHLLAVQITNGKDQIIIEEIH